MMELEDLGYGPVFAAELELLARPQWVAARVAADGRDLFPLLGCTALFGELSGKLRQGVEEGRNDRPVVGDWVAITEHGERAVIHCLLDRRTQLHRRAAGTDSLAQTIAANVDVYFVVTAVGRDLNLRRLERYLTAVWDSGASPVVVLNKIDLAEEVELPLGSIEAVAPAVPVVPVSARLGRGQDELRTYVRRGVTAAFIGSSGVGKSSLVNLLLGQERQPIAVVGADGRGRHTTTRRELLLLPSGGVLIDTPGLREFGMVDVGIGLDATFVDVAGFAVACRFGDCTHVDEPGCAVIEAVTQGALPATRLESYQRLRKEAASAAVRRDPVQGANAKRRWKAIHKNWRVFQKAEGKND